MNPLIVDAHEDLAYNILNFSRDYTRSAMETRRIEQNTLTPQRNGETLLGWQEYQKARVALIFSTLFAMPIRRRTNDWETQVYVNIVQARERYRAQVDVYYQLVEKHPEKFQLVKSQTDLYYVLSGWQRPLPQYMPSYENQRTSPIGLVMLMEGAEAIRTPGELDEWWQLGLRIIGPAWAGTRFCGGTHEPGPLTQEGRELLAGMAERGFTLDISHMDETAALQAIDSYDGPVIASHSNPIALLKGINSNRHFTDKILVNLIDHNGVMGILPNNHFLQAGWVVQDGKQAVKLEKVAAMIDYVCQLAGNARHVGIGSDFDGGFGVLQTPAEIDTIADLPKLSTILAEKGYTNEDIAAIFGNNWLDHLKRTLPDHA